MAMAHLPCLGAHDHDGARLGLGDGVQIVPELRIPLVFLADLPFLGVVGFLDVVDQSLFHHLLQLDIQGGPNREPALGHGLPQHVHDGAGLGLFDGGGALTGNKVAGEIRFAALLQPRHPYQV